MQLKKVLIKFNVEKHKMFAVQNITDKLRKFCNIYHKVNILNIKGNLKNKGEIQ